MEADGVDNLDVQIALRPLETSAADIAENAPGALGAFGRAIGFSALPLTTQLVYQVLIITKDVPLNDGCKCNLRHEGHNLDMKFGSLTVFATFNFADSYHPLIFSLCKGDSVIDEFTCDVSAAQAS